MESLAGGRLDWAECGKRLIRLSSDLRDANCTGQFCGKASDPSLFILA